MAKYVATDTYIEINGTALSDHANSVAIADNADEVDFTTFGPSGYKQFGAGMKDATITATFFSDFAANQVNSIIQPLYASGGTFTVKVRPTSGAASSTNPVATMTARVYSYSGIDGRVSDAATFDCAFRNAGTAGLVWGTT